MIFAKHVCGNFSSHFYIDVQNSVTLVKFSSIQVSVLLVKKWSTSVVALRVALQYFHKIFFVVMHFGVSLVQRKVVLMWKKCKRAKRTTAILKHVSSHLLWLDTFLCWETKRTTHRWKCCIDLFLTVQVRRECFW